ncbi:MAG: nucleotidyl transferase AbiEii/AbiGii toxin family protein, partial [Marinilabiliales bacterium]
LPERTFLEKIFLLHEELHRPEEKRKVERYSRHLYDIYKISQTKFADSAINNNALYQTIVEHRFLFLKMGGVDYNLLQPQRVNFIPPGEVLSKWESDYKTMQEQMIHGDSPSIEELIGILKEMNNKINGLGWKMDVIFKK